MSHTIFAPATARGRAGVAVVRISGPAATTALTRLTDAPLPVPRQARLMTLQDPETAAPIDSALVVTFTAPRSFTGEDVVELHIHGSPAVMKVLLATLGRMNNLRMAEAGEFTKRAFMNSKMDLTEAEALGDLINAETEAQRQQAWLQMQGNLRGLYEDWTKRVKHALAYAEATLDFPDEDLPDDLWAQIRPDVTALEREMAAHLDDKRRGERLRNGLMVTIIGAPNAGKSSLMNVLAQRDAAIVSETAGTTRDVIEVSLDLAGYPVVLADTAGLRETADAIEQEGIRRALTRAADADLVVLMLDATAPETWDLSLIKDNTLVVLNKCDRATPECPVQALPLSATTGDGLEALLNALAERLEKLMGRAGEAPVITRERHRQTVIEAHTALQHVFTAPLPELAAEHLRIALHALGRLTGFVDTEALLDVIFRDFCIGK